jgi:hypothetical protein
MGGRVWGGVMVFIGGVFLLHNLGYIHGDLARFFWPVILIGFGVAMLARNLDRPHAWAPGVGSDSTNVNRVNAWAIFSGVRRRVDSQEFEGGEALAIFGGIRLDFRQTRLSLRPTPCLEASISVCRRPGRSPCVGRASSVDTMTRLAKPRPQTLSGQTW